MKFLSVCSGIEAASVAWHPLGWTCAGVSEIEAFPRSVLIERQGAVAVDWDHRHAEGQNYTPLCGDFTQIEAHHVGAIDLIVGGTPCQSFSIAGLRGGLDDDRGNLALEFLRLADRTRPRWLVWENVPGVLSSNGGRDFGSILGGMVALGYGIAYRVLDAQYFGVPQRRRRVFVVGHFGDWRRAAAVFLERESLQGHPAPRREKAQTAPTIPSRSSAGGGLGTELDWDGGLIQTFDRQSSAEYGESGLASTVQARDFKGPSDLVAQVAGAICKDSFSGGAGGRPEGAAAGHFVPVAFSAKDYGADAMDDCSPTLRAGGHAGSHANAGVMPAVAFLTYDDGRDVTDDLSPTLRVGSIHGVARAHAVRRLTPRECERLQGFPDDYTAVMHRGKPAADGPRYKALGNSMAVPVMAWIGRRIAAVEALPPHPSPLPQGEREQGGGQQSNMVEAA